jgi:RNA ligase (TIGR02306 family)
MSTFAVEAKKISKIYPHTNADRLELGQVEGMTFQFVVQKDMYHVGDDVVYFPIDSLLPQGLVAQQNIANFLSGKDKNRVKTVALRGEISQGYVATKQSILEYLKIDTLPVDLTAALQVTKYEPPEIMTQSGNLVACPPAVYYYDIEGCDRYPNIVEKMRAADSVIISEKLEGSNMATCVETDGKVYICQHGYAIENLPDHEEHTFWKIARDEGLIDAVLKLQKDKFKDCAVTIRSEALGNGIQKNYYNLVKHTTRIFDIEVNRKAAGFPEFNYLLSYVGLIEKRVPVVSSGTTLDVWLDGKTLQEASHGQSMLVPKIREGVVIRPEIEQYVIGFGRLLLKQRDPIYLAGTGN